ncbi:MAG: right-handed parallel beta-helix repeat-containing protein [Lachnospiraceae bacterium]|nr:right-handed parallel beta-helix repeat-containing protein [Lachnospiraceae bacterium]
MAREYHVALTGNDWGSGSKEEPFATIQRAADAAMPGDTVVVHEGEYREWVDPKMGGISDIERITYCAAPGEKVVIKGSERITGWEQMEGTVWKAIIPNRIFGDFNPYSTYLYGDWMVGPQYPTVHLGDVYLNGKSFFEALSVEEVQKAEKRETGYCLPWKSYNEPIPNAEDTVYQWYAEVDSENTTIWANFQGADPNTELVEINVRKCVFYPKQSNRDYITVSGFEMAQAACPFAPPTGDQPGLIGTHWSKGWIIENNHIHDAKCSAVSLGKDEKTGDNLFTKTRRKPGYTYQFEAVGKALQLGWNKDNIGSHIVRNNVIHDCGQNGVVGHLGCVFSEVYGNEIYRIATKHEFFGYEIAGIKFHAAIDTQIYRNYIHDCTLGIWLDWETQGTRISSNLLCQNIRDLMVEVSHGPYLVDNNIFASPYSFENASQGGAYIHNLVLGNMKHWTVLTRSTPYHFPHTTAIMASSFIYGGDDRFYQNIFVGGADTLGEEEGVSCGTVAFNDHPATYDEYIDLIEKAYPGDEDLYVKVNQPVYINRNVYLQGAEGYAREEDSYRGDAVLKAEIRAEETAEGCQVYLEADVDESILKQAAVIIQTKDLGCTRAAEGLFENPDGTPITFDVDYCGQKRKSDHVIAGPINGLKVGHNRIRVW